MDLLPNHIYFYFRAYNKLRGRETITESRLKRHNPLERSEHFKKPQLFTVQLKRDVWPKFLSIGKPNNIFPNRPKVRIFPVLVPQHRKEEHIQPFAPLLLSILYRTNHSLEQY
jgi:hypothetical protein